MIDTYLYFVPLTSGKPKHAKWKNVGSAHFLIYEQVSKTELRKADIFKSLSAAEALKFFAALEIKKMIPVRADLYTRIDFAALSDKQYADLLEKESGQNFEENRTGLCRAKGNWEGSPDAL